MRSPPKIRLLTFDAWETLVHPRLPVATQYIQVLEQLGCPCRYDELQLSARLKSAVKQTRQKLPNFGITARQNTYESRMSATRSWWSEVIRLTLKPQVPTEAAIDALMTRFEGHEGYTLRPNVKSVLQRLSLLPNTVLGIISNSDVRIRNVLEELEILQYFSSITLSSECGVQKPDARIFQEALAQVIRTRARQESSTDFECLHIGNEWESDCQGALSAGWKAIYFQSDATTAPPHHTNVEVRVIDDLKDILLPDDSMS